jgi:hypothetical protein
MFLLRRSDRLQQHHVLPGEFGASAVSEYQAHAVCLYVIRGPVSGGLDRAGHHPGRTSGWEPMPFAPQPEQTLSPGVLGHLWTPVFLQLLYSKCCPLFQPPPPIATLLNPE